MLIIHGGFTEQPVKPQRAKAIREALLRILAEVDRPTALETVIEAVRLLEDDPLFNAGTGSKLQSDGQARMSAALADGTRRKFSGVINIERVQNPILVARDLLEEEFPVLAGAAATEWARGKGHPDYDPITPQRREAYGRSGTVGACARDEQGNLAVATSTGGRGHETVGRVSDTATVAGNYADPNRAVSCTGVGEHIVDEALAVRLVLRTTRWDDVFRECSERGRHFGAIEIDREGKVRHGHTGGSLFWASRVKGKVESFTPR